MMRDLMIVDNVHTVVCGIRTCKHLYMRIGLKVSELTNIYLKNWKKLIIVKVTLKNGKLNTLKQV